MIVLETDRLVLRKLTEDDAEFILALLNEPDFIRYIGDRGVRDMEDARRYIRDGAVSSHAQFGYALDLVVLKGCGTPVGICGLVNRDTLEDVDLGFAFLEGHRSKGYAFESAAAVLKHAFDVLDLRRIVAIVAPDNEASVRLLKKLGMTFERKIRLPGEDSDIDLFAVDEPG